MKHYLRLFFYSILVLGISLHTKAQDIATIAGSGSYGYSGDGGPATSAQLEYTWYCAKDHAGNVYFTDNANHRIRKVSVAGTISTVAGTGLPGYTGDGGPATLAKIKSPSGIAIDNTGDIYFADDGNHCIRKIDTSGIITTIAGTGAAGYGGDGGPSTSALLNTPYGISLDAAGNMYIADAGNNRVRKIDTAGMITTIAGDGTSGFSGDSGLATAAELSFPCSIALDIAGNLYIDDAANNRVRMVSSSGMITTVAGNGTAGFTTDTIPATDAELNQPLGIAVNGIGEIFISDQLNNRVRKVDRYGMITTIAGTGTAGYSGDGGPATVADINQPFGITLDSAGDLFICDKGNYRLREIKYNNHVPAFIMGAADSIVICENDSAVSMNAMLAVTDPDIGQAMTWDFLKGPSHGTAPVAYTAVSTGGTITPVGLSYNPYPGFAGRDTMKVRIDDGFSIDTMSIYVRVKPLPAITPIIGSANVCIGTPDSLSDTSAGGVWSCSNANAVISGTGVVNGLSYGKDTVQYTITHEGCVSSVSKALAIYPPTDSIYGPSAVCVHLDVAWTGIPSGGTWTTSNGVVLVSSDGLVGGVTPGVDTVTYTVTTPCGTSSFKKVITVNAMIAPTVLITASPGAHIEPGESDTLKANIITGAGIAYSYQWEKNGMAIPGATDSTYISNTFADNDSMTCIVTNGPCAASSFAWIYIVYGDAGVTFPGDPGAELMLMPNPNNGEFSIEGVRLYNEQTVQLTITNILGQVMYETPARVVNGRLKKEISPGVPLPQGMYLLHVAANGGNTVIRFMVNR